MSPIANAVQILMSAKPKPKPSSGLGETPSAPISQTPTSDGGGFHLNLNPIEIIGAAPWLIPLLLILGWIGLLFGWKKLVLMWNIKGQPLRSSPYQGLKEALRLMWKEDVYQVFARKQELALKTVWFTWVRFWRWLFVLTLFTFLIGPKLSFLGNMLLAIISISWIIGISHVMGIFRYRHRVLMQMFEVAASEMKYMKGAELNPWAYVQISSWEQVYSPTTTVVMFNTKYRGDDGRNQQAFELHFNSAVSEQHSWSYTWEPANNRVICEPVPHIPSNVEYKFPDTNPWNVFPLGVTATGEEAVWNVSQAPHILIAGSTGGGKSVTQRTILLHALQTHDWSVVLIDPKMVELSAYRGRPGVLRVAIEIDESLQLTEQVRQEMSGRYLRMKEAGVNHFKDLPEPPPALLLMVDETFSLLSPTGLRSEEGKEIDAMKARIGTLLSDIARLGRAAGVHLALATQRPDAKVLPGELKANLDARIAQGRMDVTPSLMTLDSDAATRLPAIKGRAILRTGSDYTEFQAYFLPPQFLPQVLEMCAYARDGGDLSTLMGEDVPEAAAPETNGISSVVEGAKETISKLHVPKVKLGFVNRIKSWAERRQAEIDEREVHSGRTEEARSELARRKAEREAKRENKRKQEEETSLEQAADTDAYSPSQALQNRSIDDVIGELEPQGLSMSHLESLFPVKKANEKQSSPEKIGNAGTIPVPASSIPAPTSASPDELDEFDDDEFGYVDDLDENEPAINIPNPNSVPLPTVPLPVSPLVSQPTQQMNVVEVEETPLAGPGFDLANMTVQDVIQRAAARGVPIPASELLAALRAEASRQKASPSSPPRTTEPASSPSLESGPITLNTPVLTPKMPKPVIPAPPVASREADSDSELSSYIFEEEVPVMPAVLEQQEGLLTDLDRVISGSDLSQKRPTEAPWMPAIPRKPSSPGQSPFAVPTPPAKPVEPKPNDPKPSKSQEGDSVAEEIVDTDKPSSFRLPPLPPPPPKR